MRVIRGSCSILNSGPPRSLVGRQRGEACLGVDHHRAELEDLELAAVAADPCAAGTAPARRPRA